MKNYKLIELNNKSRKGLYIYVKEPNKKGKYYKTQEGIPIKTLIEYHETKQKQKDKKIKIKKPTKRRRRTIESTLKKGIKTVKVHELNTQGIHTAKKRLFRNIVKDKDLLEILINEHNLQKIKHRFDYKLTAKGKEGTLFTAEKLNITPQKALEDTKDIHKGENNGGSKWLEGKKIHKNGWTINSFKNGRITDITMTITFRKG